MQESDDKKYYLIRRKVIFQISFLHCLVIDVHCDFVRFEEVREKKPIMVCNLSALKPLLRITIEPVLALYMLSAEMISTTNVTMVMERVCRLTFGHSTEVCHDMFDNPAFEDQKIQSQKLANNLLLVSNFVLTTPGIFLAIMTGPWSDKHGRRAPIIIPLIGSLIYNFGLVLMAYFTQLPAYVIICLTIPNALCGGFIHVMTLMSYIADVTTPGERTLKYVFIYGVCVMAAPLGRILAGYIFSATNFTTVYCISTGAIALATIYAIFFVKETRGLDENLTIKELIWEFFRLSNATECLAVLTKPREKNGRRIIFLLVGVISIFTFYIGKNKHYFHIF